MKYFKSPMAMINKVPFLPTIVKALDKGATLVSKDKMTAASGLVWLMLRHANNCQGTLGVTHSLATTLGTLDTWDVGLNQAEWIANAKRDLFQKA